MRLVNNTLLALLAFAANAEGAADDSGWYGRVSLGINSINTDQLVLVDNSGTQNASADFNASFTGGGSVGYRYGERWRVEADVTYRSAETDRIEFANGTVYTDGNFASLTIGLTGIYDIFGASRGPWQPYVGAGLGWVQEVDIDFEDAAGEVSYSGDDIALSFLAGVRYQPAKWFVDAEIRYFDLGDLDLDGESGTGSVRTDYDPLSLTIGAGFQF